MKTRGLSVALLLGALVALSGCDDATVASQNLSRAADNFEINRRVVFYNGITGGYILSIEGRCAFSVKDTGNKVDVICKTGEREFKKHSLGISDNVTYFSEQLAPADVSVYHYRVTFKPQTILPDIDFRGSTEALKDLVK